MKVECKKAEPGRIREVLEPSLSKLLAESVVTWRQIRGVEGGIWVREWGGRRGG